MPFKGLLTSLLHRPQRFIRDPVLVELDRMAAAVKPRPMTDAEKHAEHVYKKFGTLTNHDPEKSPASAVARIPLLYGRHLRKDDALTLYTSVSHHWEGTTLVSCISLSGSGGSIRRTDVSPSMQEAARKLAEEKYPYLNYEDAIILLRWGYDRGYMLDGKLVASSRYWQSQAVTMAEHASALGVTSADLAKGLNEFDKMASGGVVDEINWFPLVGEQVENYMPIYSEGVTSRNQAKRVASRDLRMSMFPTFVGVDLASGPDETMLTKFNGGEKPTIEYTMSYADYKRLQEEFGKTAYPDIPGMPNSGEENVTDKNSGAAVPPIPDSPQITLMNVAQTVDILTARGVCYDKDGFAIRDAQISIDNNKMIDLQELGHAESDMMLRTVFLEDWALALRKQDHGVNRVVNGNLPFVGFTDRPSGYYEFAFRVDTRVEKITLGVGTVRKQKTFDDAVLLARDCLRNKLSLSAYVYNGSKGDNWLDTDILYFGENIYVVFKSGAPWGVTTTEALAKQMRDAPVQQSYPRNTETPFVVQYDENVFVWLDETGNVGGAAPFEAQAADQLRRYEEAMDGGTVAPTAGKPETSQEVVQKFNVGPRTMRKVFQEAGLTNLHDMQAVLDQVEKTLTPYIEDETKVVRTMLDGEYHA